MLLSWYALQGGGRLPPAPPHPLLFFNRLPLLPTLFRFYSYVFPVVFFWSSLSAVSGRFSLRSSLFVFLLILICFFFDPSILFFFDPYLFFFDPLAGFGSFFENQKKVSCWHRLPWGHGPQVSSGRCCKKVTTPKSRPLQLWPWQLHRTAHEVMTDPSCEIICDGSQNQSTGYKMD